MNLRSWLKTTTELCRQFRIEDQLDDEVRAEGMAANMSLLEDGQRSPIKPGGVKQVRSQRIRTPMGLFRQDVRFGLRQLWKNPGFTFFRHIRATIGFDAKTAIFSVVNTVLLKPLSYANADRLVNFLFSASGIADNLHCVAEFHFFERQTNLFKEVVAFDNAGPGFNLGWQQPPRAAFWNLPQTRQSRRKQEST